MAQSPNKLFLAVGVSHRSASVALREQLFAGTLDPAALLADVRNFGLADALVLATCERLELWAADGGAGTEVAFSQTLARRAALEAEALSGQTYCHRDAAAVRHVFAVTASLDSQVVGDSQVLGHVKASHRQAAAAGLAGAKLELVLQAAYGAAERIRAETELAQQPTALADAALRVARDVHGDLSRRAALLIGLGEMGEFLAARAKDARIGNLVIVHPTVARSEAVARRLGCHFRLWDDFAEALAAADVVIAATGTGRYTVGAAQAEAALKRRRREPMLFLDAALPGDIDPAVAALDAAFVFDLADLERVARQGQAKRETATSAAWRILDDELAAFQRQRSERAAGSSVAALHRRFEAARAEILTDSALSAEEATRRLINQLLHDPSEALRQAAAQSGSASSDLEAAMRRLFRLDRGGKEETE